MAKANAKYIVGGIAVVAGIALVGGALVLDHTRNNGNVRAAFVRFLFGDDTKTKVDDSNDQQNGTSPKRNNSNQVSDEAPQTDDQHGDGGSSKLDERVHAPSKSSMKSRRKNLK